MSEMFPPVSVRSGYEECFTPCRCDGAVECPCEIHGTPDAYAEQPEGPAMKAHSVVRGQRQTDYGHPLDNHQRIADFWTVRLRDKLKPGAVIEPWEASALMRLVKEARLMHSPGHEDTLTDICGYADVEDLIHREAERRGTAS